MDKQSSVKGCARAKGFQTPCSPFPQALYGNFFLVIGLEGKDIVLPLAWWTCINVRMGKPSILSCLP